MNTTQQLYLDLLKRCLTGYIYDESAWELVSQKMPAGNPLRHPWRWLRTTTRNYWYRRYTKRNQRIVQLKPFLAEKRISGGDWPLFGYSMIGFKRLENIQVAIETVVREGIPGDLIETGVWRGGACIYMKGVLRCLGIEDRTIWLADSFEGLPPPKDDQDGWDMSETDYLKVSLEQVRDNFRRFDLLDDHVKFLKGWFCDSLPTAPVNKLAILRMDGDLYSSTMDALTNLYHKLSPGGFAIVDDYHSWPGCKRAVTEFLAAQQVTPEIVNIDTHSVYWRK